MVVRYAFLVLCAALALGALERSARGYVVNGGAWPGGVIRYYNAAADQRWAVQQAVRAWNTSGARVRFVAVPAREADLRIEHFPGPSCTINAESTLGYARQPRVWIPHRDETSPYCNSYMAVQAMVHEFGHVLGLGHETRGCSRMNPTDTLQGPGLCPHAEPWQWGCRLLTTDDVAGAIALYGGHVRLPSGPRVCDVYAGIGTPAGLAVSWTSVPHQVRVSFRRPAPVSVPAFLSAEENAPEAYVAAATRGKCETDPHRHARIAWNVPPGGVQSTAMTLAPGTYCFTAWAVDSFGRPSARPAALWVRI